MSAPPTAGSSPARRGHGRRAALGLLVAAVLVILVARAGDLRLTDVGAVLRGAAPGPLALAAIVYASSYVGRAARLAVLLGAPASLPHLASISTRHTFLNMVLPFRSGEAALPLLLRSETGRSLAEGAAALVVCRVLDLVSVCALLLVGLTLTARDGATLAAVAPRALAVGVGLALVLALLRPVGRALAPRLAGPGRVRDFLGRAAGHLGATTAPRLTFAALASLLAWLATYAACWLLVVAMAGDAATASPLQRELAGVGFPTALVGTTALHLTAILPVNTPGGVGAWEAGWTAGYVLAGVDKGAAAASAVGSHVFVFGFAALLAFAGLALRPTPARPGPRADTLL